MSRVFAGVQAGVITLVFILLVASDHIAPGTAGWATVIAGLSILIIHVLRKSTPVVIAIAVVAAGLICMAIYLISGSTTLATSLVAGVILGGSWTIAISHSAYGGGL
ncbi:MAG: hypothetical protein J7J17_00270 [Hadesarchaea archaeon]|nr:hypothetical protein [Hadesarchaea archaeon]